MNQQERRDRLLTVLRNSLADGVSPSVRDLCRETDIPSASTVWGILRYLEEEGIVHLIRSEKSGRVSAISLTEPDGTVFTRVPVLTALDPITGRETPEQPARSLPFLIPKVAYGLTFAVTLRERVDDLCPGDTAVFVRTHVTPLDRPTAVCVGHRLTVGVVRETKDGPCVTTEGLTFRLGAEADVCVVGRLLGVTRRYF